MQDPRICLFCKKTFFKPYSCSKNTWEKYYRFCSIKCRAQVLPPRGMKEEDYLRGEKHPNWKGGTSYWSLHKWIAKEKGKANKCEFDPSHTSKQFEWSNKSQKYLRDLSDWQQLCHSCYRKYDNKMNNRVPWNKGKKGSQVAWNKGIKGKDSHSFGNQHGFRKGNIPWNKYESSTD